MTEAKKAAAVGKERRILILGDTDFHRVPLSSLLSSKGAAVTLARTAAGAIGRLEDERFGFDVLVLNFCHPDTDAMKVLEYTKGLGQKFQIPIYAIKRVFSTATEESGLHALGVKGFLDKSLFPEQIIYRLGEELFAGVMEKRKWARIPVFLPTDYRIAEHVLSGYVTDISSGGVYLQTADVKPEWADVATRVTFRLPSVQEIFTIPGAIRHTKPGIGMGVGFSELAPDFQAKIDDFIKTFLLLALKQT
jgi:CheY-like chemotaxis protein